VIVGGIVSGTLFTLLVLPLAIGMFGNFYDEAQDEPVPEGAR